ncbi:MAG: acyl-CoA dehydrogenase family protein [Gammaproteobacteria bacterium]|nr:acyl-CoA dehydrogenase family protein [Gammaproteobacteria bacterium]
MDFLLNEEQLSIQSMVSEFAEHEMAPFAAEWDQQHIFPLDTLRKAAGLGLAGIYVSSDVGGSGLSRLDAAIIFEALATACPSTAAYLSIHNMVAGLIDKHANQALREKWLPRLISMDVTSSYCLTEPQAGSDAASLQSTATIEGEDYILNGAKAFISGGSTSDVYACMVRTGDQSAHGISCILVEKNTPGLSFGKREPKMGWHSQPTTMVFFDNCRVPQTNLIGQEGQGFKIALSALNGGRINIAACSLGGAKQCLSMVRTHMQERKQFKKTLSQMDALQFRVADMLTDLEASRLLTYRAATALDAHDPQTIMYCAMAKRLSTDLCFNICNQALQLYGGYGYIQDYPIERYFRDLRVHQILEGSNEIMRLIIAKQFFSPQFHM